jgi:5-methylcytosine-specific restriction enzyme subunit McrC
MIEKTLSQILSDGSLVDNTVHTVRENVFRAVSNGVASRIRPGKGKKNNSQKIWALIRKAEILPTEASKLIFLVQNGQYEHNTNDAFVNIRGISESDFSLTTGNLIGCFRADGYTLTVSSRFGDDFLKYIIADADGFLELPEQGGTKKGDYEWLLIYLWLVKLKKAFRLGLPKAYATRSENLTELRGRLDPVDYFLNHGRASYRCTYREHRYDNEATRLIARTLQHLESHAFLQDAQALNQTFQIAIQGQRSTLLDLLATRPLRNPYYADYNPVIALSKQILRNELADFGDKSQTSGFFFDVSMLFEYFVRKLLKRAGLLFYSKNDCDWPIPSGLPNDYTRRSLIPDLVFDIGGATYVFDVKYKSFDFHNGVNREDLFQLHTYIGKASNILALGGCGFIYPIRESRWEEHGLGAIDGIFSDTITQARRLVPFHVAFIKVPQQKDGSRVFRTSFRTQVENFGSAFLKRLHEFRISRQQAVSDP